MHSHRSVVAAILGMTGIGHAVQAINPSLTNVWAEPAGNYLVNTGMRSGRGKGGKTAHRHTGIRAQKRAALKARNRARA